jgi:hypothetical protein
VTRTSVREAAVDLRRDAGIAHVGMHRIGEINRRSFFRQFDDIAMRRKSENMVFEKIDFLDNSCKEWSDINCM